MMMRAWPGLCLIVLLCACSGDAFRGTEIRGVDWGGDFTLTAHTGERLRSTDLRGRAVVLFFGFTHCPDICAPTLLKLAQAVRMLGDDADRVRVLFVSVDPAHDTPTRLAEFLPAFHPSFTGLTGTSEEIAAVARDHRVPYDPQAPMAHSGVVLVKDAGGRPRLLFRNEFTPDDLAHDLRLLFAR